MAQGLVSRSSSFLSETLTNPTPPLRKEEVVIGPVIRIVRVEVSQEFGTFGVLCLGPQAFCVTLEPPWKGNEKEVSSIFPKTYMADRVRSPRFGETYRLRKVPGRTLIEFHPGNSLKDTHGCILVGSEFGKLREGRGVLNSGKTFRKLMAKLERFSQVVVSIVEVV